MTRGRLPGQLVDSLHGRSLSHVLLLLLVLFATFTGTYGMYEPNPNTKVQAPLLRVTDRDGVDVETDVPPMFLRLFSDGATEVKNCLNGHIYTVAKPVKDQMDDLSELMEDIRFETPSTTDGESEQPKTSAKPCHKYTRQSLLAHRSSSGPPPTDMTPPSLMARDNYFLFTRGETNNPINRFLLERTPKGVLIRRWETSRWDPSPLGEVTQFDGKHLHFTTTTLDHTTNMDMTINKKETSVLGLQEFLFRAKKPSTCTVIVSGAGSEYCNGRYTNFNNELEHGKKVFRRNVGSQNKIYWLTDNTWNIGCKVGMESCLEKYDVISQAQEPPTAGWKKTNNGQNPVPVIKVQQWTKSQISPVIKVEPVDKIADWVKEHGISQGLSDRQNDLLKTIGDVVKKSLPEAEFQRCVVHGSVAYDMATDKSDMDVALEFSMNLDPRHALGEVAKELRLLWPQHDIRLIAGRVPIIRLKPNSHVKAGLCCQCDIKIANRLEGRAFSGRSEESVKTETIKRLMSADPRVRPLSMWVKEWAKGQGISDAPAGYLPSFGYLIMTIHYLQVERTIQNMDELFQGFLEYYTNFKWDKHGVSVKDPNVISKDTVGSLLRLMVVQDPVMHAENLGRNINANIRRTILSKFQEELQALKAAKERQSIE